ncbi:hypothetical protein TcasGA2_TC013222 [Tribolium castaneum]|uniref:Uncharacterized protein n=1 Tax=Tribolium castaneum TaxID=7070 RepID=D6WMK5_TRICA|nr:hypothetical protein TcasGA2_TC013222 [Tribolium castaneum]
MAAPDANPHLLASLLRLLVGFPAECEGTPDSIFIRTEISQIIPDITNINDTPGIRD